RELYLTKQREILNSSVHLLEIDLLRHGAYTVAAPHTHLNWTATWDYIVSLQRGGQPYCEAWPILLRQRLPRVLVPLAGKDPDVVLNLQAVLDHCYDAGRYLDDLDYRRPPPVPLTRSGAKWANALLRERGLRP